MAPFDEPPSKPILCSQGGFAYNREHIEYWQQRAARAEAEIGRLRTVVRVNALRAGHSDADIDRVLNEGVS
jgi:hypothetical protein